MGVMVIFTKLSDLGKAKKHPNVWIILCRGSLDNFIKACRFGNDQRLANYVVNTWDNGVCKILRREIHFNESAIVEAIGLPNRGKEVKQNSKASKIEKVQKFEGEEICLE